MGSFFGVMTALGVKHKAGNGENFFPLMPFTLLWSAGNNRLLTDTIEYWKGQWELDKATEIDYSAVISPLFQ